VCSRPIDLAYVDTDREVIDAMDFGANIEWSIVPVEG